MSSQPDALEGHVAPTVRAAGAVYVANAVGFGVGAIWTLWYLGQHGELPMTPFGFRAFSGPFEALGTATLAAVGWTFVGLCVLEALAGFWLCRGERRGATVGLATTPLAVVLGAGFALPLYLISIPVRLALLALGRGTLR
jgi:hypothetical protein